MPLTKQLQIALSELGKTAMHTATIWMTRATYGLPLPLALAFSLSLRRPNKVASRCMIGHNTPHSVSWTLSRRTMAAVPKFGAYFAEYGDHLQGLSPEEYGMASNAQRQ